MADSATRLHWIKFHGQGNTTKNAPGDWPERVLDLLDKQSKDAGKEEVEDALGELGWHRDREY